MKTDLQLSHVDVMPGSTARVEIDVTNNADVIDGITAIVDGINPDWVRLEQPLISLFPEAVGRLALIIDIPATCPAGDYLIIARIVSTIDADRQTVHDFWLTVRPVPALSLELRPIIVSGGAEATIAATVINTGNTTSEVTINALEPTRDIDCTPTPSHVIIPQDHEALVDIRLRGKRPWFGSPVDRSITITAHVGDLTVEKVGTFRQNPKVPRGVLTALVLAAIVLLWALIFLLVITQLRRTVDPAKAVGTDLIDGPQNIPLAKVAATIQGTVTASTTGGGIPKITVSAMRVTADGSLASVGSAATDDDGKYSLQSLIPGTYKLRFSADGYATVWYLAGTDETTADDVILQPKDTLDDLDVVLVGQTGRLLGSVALPPDSPPTVLTVTATQVVEQSNGDAGPPPSFVQTTADGTIDLGGLPTPATYTVTVTGAGFQTQQFEQRLSGGQASVMNTVNLGAATGSIDGNVSDAAGTPLGGVTVVARSGDIEIRSTTPTTGNVGQFRLVGLSTPQTYALTFDLPNYSGATVALDLGPGESRSGVNAILVGGSGTLAGAAVAPDGTPLGGIAVTVLGDEFRSDTATLTTSGAGGAAGSFTVTDLPVPGNYTISFSDPRYQTETLNATYLAAGTQLLGNVQLLPIGAEIRGTVSGIGGGLGGVTVTLSDGKRPRTTTSATNPAGTYVFANVAPGSYTLTFTQAGYTTRVTLITVAGGIDQTANTTLTPIP